MNNNSGYDKNLIVIDGLFLYSAYHCLVTVLTELPQLLIRVSIRLPPPCCKFAKCELNESGQSARPYIYLSLIPLRVSHIYQQFCPIVVARVASVSAFAFYTSTRHSTREPPCCYMTQTGSDDVEK